MAGSLKQKRLESQKRTAIEEGAVLPSEEKVDVASSYKQAVFFGAGPVWTTRRYNKPVLWRSKLRSRLRMPSALTLRLGPFCLT